MQTVLEFEVAPAPPAPPARYQAYESGFSFLREADCWPWVDVIESCMFPHSVRWPLLAGCSWMAFERHINMPMQILPNGRSLLRPAFVDDFGTLVRVAA